MTNDPLQSVLMLVNQFAAYLAHRQDSLSCFCEQGVQIEGWLKGELLTFLRNEQRADRLHSFGREVKPGLGLKKVDITVNFEPSETCWIELKHFLIGKQKGTRYNCQWYFKEKSLGILTDVEKLVGIESPNRFILILCTSNPGNDDWNLAVKAMENKFDYRLESLSDATTFPNSYFLGLLHLPDELDTRKTNMEMINV